MFDDDIDKEFDCRKYVSNHEKEVLEFFKNEYSDERISEDDEFVENYISIYGNDSERYDK